MPDKNEIEIKFLLDDPISFKRALIALGAQKKSERYEWNIRLDGADNSLLAAGKMLRVRRTEANGVTKYVITVKVDPKNKVSTAYRIRREIEFEAVGNGDTIQALFDALGYQPVWHYEKRREVFLWNTVEIDLDQMPYGWFAEFEGQPDVIEALVTELNWINKPRVLLSYQEIFQAVRQALNLPEMDLTFANFSEINVPLDHILGLLDE